MLQTLRAFSRKVNPFLAVEISPFNPVSRPPSLPRRADHTREKQSEINRPWYPVTINLNALVALRGPSCVFVDHSFFSFRLFQAIPSVG